MAVLKANVDFLQLLIGAEGARLLRDREVTGDPAGVLKRRGGSRTFTLGKRAPGAEINNQVSQCLKNKKTHENFMSEMSCAPY
ncbi:hypothetical protein J2S10_000682 [Neobacillus ginsengisoli]|uniref:Uncharacterized protein n=1 Tax=Neobacillus ginsengisoli TaxID=904295 RepID=A0ABT9XRM2_9BACI|nr:hypothetical protein [Neobacillus ginsengisoli]